MVYLVFSEGYAARFGDSQLRQDVTAEAIRLGRNLAGLMPDEAEVLGLLALMLLNDSRREARVDAGGGIVPLEDQDRSRWNREAITEGVAMVEKALRMGAAGEYQLQAAIAAVHAEAPSFEETDWQQIVALYGTLAQVRPNPVVEMSRAVAVSNAYGAQQGLALLDALTDQRDGDHRFHAARAMLLGRLGRTEEQREALDRAIGLCTNEAERRRLEGLRDGAG